MVAEEPFRKWPRDDSLSKSFASLEEEVSFGVQGRAHYFINVRGFVHLYESGCSLIEEAKDNRIAELVIIGLVHFKNLRKGLHAQVLLEVGLGGVGLQRESARSRRRVIRKVPNGRLTLSSAGDIVTAWHVYSTR